MMGALGGASGGFSDTDSATASLAWACLLLFVLVFAGGVVVGVAESTSFSSAPAFQLRSAAQVAGWSRHARRYDFGCALGWS